MIRQMAIGVFGAFFCACAVSTASAELVAHFSFDNVDGDSVPDSSGFDNDGTIEGDVDVVPGGDGDGVAFENSRVLIAASDSFTAEMFAEGEFTVVMWMNPTLTGNPWQQVFRAGGAPNDTLFVNNDGRLSWRGMVDAVWAGGMAETAAGVLASDTWAHVGVTSDGDKFRIYVAGEIIVDGAFQQTMGANTEYAVGGFAGGESYTGAVDDFAVFTDTLPQADIVSIMDDGMAGYLAVEAAGKLATQWGDVKAAR
ncbi:MAG: LamG domain-containing protein [Myxococcota bacterium]